MNTPKTDSVIKTVYVAFIGYDGLSSSPEEYVEPDFARSLETELRNALTWMETYHRSFGEPATGPLAQDIDRIKELLK